MQEKYGPQGTESLTALFDDMQISTERAVFKKFCITPKDVEDLSRAFADHCKIFEKKTNSDKPKYLNTFSSHSFKSSENNINFADILKTVVEKTHTDFKLSACSTIAQNPIHATTLAAFDSVLLVLKKCLPDNQKAPKQLYQILFQTPVSAIKKLSKTEETYLYRIITYFIKNAWQDKFEDEKVVRENITRAMVQIMQELTENSGMKYEKIPKIIANLR